MKDFYTLSRFERYAYPGARINYTQLPPFRDANQLWMMTEDGDWLTGVFLPGDQQKQSAILYFYGHGENLYEAEATLQHFCDLGHAVLCFDYRGYGASRGKPNEKALLNDALFAYDWLHENHPNLQIIASGRSMGTAMATWVANHRELQGLILTSAPTNMVDVVKHIFPPNEIIIEDALPFRYDNLGNMTAIRCPVLFVHGSRDQLVPIMMARQLAHSLSTPHEFMEIDHAGHDDLLDVTNDQLWKNLDIFVHRCVTESNKG